MSSRIKLTPAQIEAQIEAERRAVVFFQREISKAHDHIRLIEDEIRRAQRKMGRLQRLLSKDSPSD